MPPAKSARRKTAPKRTPRSTSRKDEPGALEQLTTLGKALPSSYLPSPSEVRLILGALVYVSETGNTEPPDPPEASE